MSNGECLFSKHENCKPASAIAWLGTGTVLDNPLLKVSIVITRGGSFPLCNEHRKQLESSFPFPILGNEN